MLDSWDFGPLRSSKMHDISPEPPNRAEYGTGTPA